MCGGSGTRVGKRAPVSTIEGAGAPLPIADLDTDQIMPKQFLRITDKAGLADGLLHDLRFDGAGNPQPDFVLNRAEYRAACILVCGPNFGCGSSREHAVWGLRQYGIRALIAPSFADIFYSNALNNGLVTVALPQPDVDAILRDVSGPGSRRIAIDVEALTVRSDARLARFWLSPRHQRMLLEGTDAIDATLEHRLAIAAFTERHWAARPWLKDVAAKTRERLERGSGSST